MFEKLTNKFQKQKKEKKSSYFATREETELYTRKFIDMGYLRLIYKAELFSIYHVSRFTYYMFIHDSGLIINIRGDSLLKIIDNPGKLLNYFFQLPDHIKLGISFFLAHPNTETFFKKLQEKRTREPETVNYNPEMEQKIYDLYGYPEDTSSK